MIKVSAGCPTFDGTDYPYWKNKMRIHLEAIDNDLSYVVENGVPSVSPSPRPAFAVQSWRRRSHPTSAPGAAGNGESLTGEEEDGAGQEPTMPASF